MNTILLEFILMSFKHIKLAADNDLMQSIEFAAKENGMLKDKPAENEVEMQIDLSVSASFDQNILKLANGLRTKGFNSYADDLEEKFATLKLAKTNIYKTHKEEGEDLVEEAHPEGDKHMADATDALGEVETVVSRHKKMVDVINKVPTGKLAAKLLNEIKLVILAQSAPEATDKKKDNFTQIVKDLVNIINNYVIKSFDRQPYLDIPLGSSLENQKKVEEYIDLFKDYQAYLTDHFTYFGQDWSKKADDKLVGYVDTAIKKLKEFLELAQAKATPNTPEFDKRFDNPNAEAQILVPLRALEHRFLAFYNENISNDTQGAKYHSSFVSSSQLRDIANELNNRTSKITYFIDKILLQSKLISEDQDIVKYLNDMKSFIDVVKKDFDTASEKLFSSETSSADILLENSKEFEKNMEDIKKAFEGTNIFKYLNFDNFASFSKSINDLASKITNRLKELAQNPKLADIKNKLISLIPVL